VADNQHAASAPSEKRIERNSDEAKISLGNPRLDPSIRDTPPRSF